MSNDCLARGTMPETTGADREGHVVLGALPLKKGQLRGTGAFGLAVNGREFPMDGTAAAWWPDGSVKWLRLCGAVDLKGGCDNAFTVAALPGATAGGLAATHLPGIESITGGPLSVRISPDANRVLEVRDAAGRLLTRGPGLSARLRARGRDDRPRPALDWTFEPGNARVVVESLARVVVRLGGRFVEDGRVLGELVTFIEIVKDEPRLGIQPVFIFLGDPDRDRIESLQVSVHTIYGSGDGARFGFGQDRGPGLWDDCQWLPDGHRWPQVRQVQAGSTFYKLEKRTGPAGGWVKIREGQRAQGWCHLGGAAGGVTGAIRYFWQEYPRTLAVDADAGTVSFGLVPEEGEPLDLRRYSPVILGGTIYEAGEGAIDSAFYGAHGIAKSSELMVRFHAAGEERLAAAKAGLFWTRPVRLVPEPAGFAASGAAGTLEAAAPAGYEDGEERVKALASFLFEEREARGWYGLLNYGDVMQTYYTSRGQWAYDDGGYGWVNTESLPDLGLWLTALRHGRIDWLEGAIAMTRHNRDVDMYHRGNFKGVGSRHNVNHWGCKDKEWRISMPLVKRFHDYLTGDPWTREVILETVGVYQTYERTSSAAASMGAALSGLMVKAEMTGRAQDFDAVVRMLDVYARAVREDGHMARQLHVNLATGEGEPVFGTTRGKPLPGEDGTLMGSYFFLLGFGAQHALTEAAATYAHAPLIRALIRHADLYLGTFDMTRWAPYQVPRAGGAILFLALAFRETGFPRFRDSIAQSLAQGYKGPDLGTEGGEGVFDEPRRRILLDMERKNKITCSIGDLMHLRPYGYAAIR
jgi:hypothetical protein